MDIEFRADALVNQAEKLLPLVVPVPIHARADDWQRHDLPDPGGTIILTPPAD